MRSFIKRWPERIELLVLIDSGLPYQELDPLKPEVSP